MTEQEAQEKWCPFAFTPAWQQPSAPAANRVCDSDAEWPLSSRCIASDCMMWTGTDCGLKRTPA